MKRKNKTSYSRKINGVRLFLEDLEDIIALLESKSLEVKIEDSENTYDSLDEIYPLLGLRPTKLIIEGSDPKTWVSISIQIESKHSWIFSRGSAEMRTLGIELKDILNSKVPNSFKLSSPYFFGSPAVFFFFIWSKLIEEEIETTHDLLIFRISVLFFIFWIISFINKRISYGPFLKRKHEVGFFRRNKDKILLAIIAAVGGGIITLFFQWLKSK